MNHNFNSLEEKKISSTEYFRNAFLHVTEDDVTLPNEEITQRVVIHHPGGVNLIALDEKKRLILVEQYRYCIGMPLIETPAGKSEPGEENIITAARELEEETGYRAQNLVSLGRFTASPGYSTEYIENFLATGLVPLEEKIQGDADEFLNLYHVTKAEAWEWVADGRIQDFKTVYAVQYLTMNGLW